METSLVVLAAGIGSRYGGLKQLESVGPSGETLLEYSIFDALRAGFDRVVLIIRPETEDEFRLTLGARLGNETPLTYAYQTLNGLPLDVDAPRGRSKPWGTAHAVMATAGVVDGPFAVINADDFYGSDAFMVLGEFLRTNHCVTPATYALAGFSVGPTLSDAGPVSRGLCRVDADGRLEEIVEVAKLFRHGSGGRFIDAHGTEHLVPADDLVSMNMWGFTPAVFPELRERFRHFLESSENREDLSSEFLVPDVVQDMIADGSAHVQALRHRGRWCGITYPEDRQRARSFIADLVAQGDYPPRLWE